MFNVTASNNLGYNGVSQIPDARCTPPYEAADSPAGDKLRPYLHEEVQSGERKAPHQRRQMDSSKGHPPEDVYTFKDSDLHFSDSSHSNPRLRSPSRRKSDTATTPRFAKQVNGFSPVRGTPLSNGVHEGQRGGESKASLTPSQFNSSPFLVSTKQKVKNDLFSNLAMGSPSEEGGADTKHSITRYSEEKVKVEEVEVKTEPCSWGTEGRVTAPLFSSPYRLPPATPQHKPSPAKTSSPRSRKGRGPALHEALQRISSHSSLSSSLTSNAASSSGVSVLPASAWVSPSTGLFECSSLDVKQQEHVSHNYIQPWLEGVSGCEPALSRAERLAARRAALRRRTTQLTRYSESLHSSYSLHDAVRSRFEKSVPPENGCGQRLAPSTLERLLASRGYTTLLTAVDRKKVKATRVVGGRQCVVAGCSWAGMACAAYCSRHITSCGDQRLFSCCTAKFSDNTQCKMPVVNITNHLPLCDEHAWKRDNYNKISQESKPKKAPRKRPKPSAMIRPQKRNRKRRKPTQANNTTSHRSTPPTEPAPPTLPSTQSSTSSGCEESTEESGIGLTEEFIEADTSHHIVDEEVVAQVLGLQAEEERAPSQDTNLDNMLYVFNDLFAAEHPTREETEELERALEAVNQDVKSLEKLTASQGGGLLDTFLDERALAETLASLPDVFSPSPNCTA